MLLAGIGTLWAVLDLISPSDCSDQVQMGYPVDARFVGSEGSSYLYDVGYTDDDVAPVQSEGSSGTACVHWDETVFGTELMSAYLTGNTNPLSILTAGSLQDLGYIVDLSSPQIDPFDVNGQVQGRSRKGAKGGKKKNANGTRLIGCAPHKQMQRMRSVGAAHMDAKSRGSGKGKGGAG